MSGVAKMLAGRFPLSRFPADFADGSVYGVSPANPDCLILLDRCGISGVVQHIPLPFVRYGTGVAVVASSLRHTKHPAWSNSLLMNPETTVMVNRLELAVRARLAGREEAQGLWPELVAVWPPLRTHLKRVHKHRIRVFILEPAG